MKPILAITMGDPAGVGPEIAVKALADPAIYDDCRPLVVGSPFIMRRATEFTGKPDIRINEIGSVAEARFECGVIDVLDPGLEKMEEVVPGKVRAVAGEAAFKCVVKAIELAMAKEVDGTVTNPLNKEAINLAGHHFSGHTEIYAHYTNTKKYTMMLMHENMRVVHVSTHVSLREACDRVKKERVLECIRIAADACRQLGIENPRVGVAGLNPHCGENGLFGREDLDEIAPAVEAAKAEGIDATGPVAPDTVFSKMRGGWFDIVVAMYHDQGHIPMKVVGFVYNEEKGEWDAVAGVNITCGLPIIRVSVDHGTAMGHAGHGNASELSLVNSINCAAQLARHRG